jgi:hypothetical protein
MSNKDDDWTPMGNRDKYVLITIRTNGVKSHLPLIGLP